MRLKIQKAIWFASILIVEVNGDLFMVEVKFVFGNETVCLVLHLMMEHTSDVSYCIIFSGDSRSINF